MVVTAGIRLLLGAGQDLFEGLGAGHTGVCTL
jgi:hypothetical protein